METFFIIGVLVAGFAVVGFLLWRQRSDNHKDGGLLLLQNQISEINRTLDHRLGESAKLMQSQASELFQNMRRIVEASGKLEKEITEKLVKVDEGQKQVVSFADQLRNLQDILKNPKQRGVLGEYYLEAVLQNVLPDKSYQMQYAFKDGSIVDAAIFVKDRIIPVDSKFSLENYNRLIEAREPAIRERYEGLFRQDLKARIDETAKYVKPSEKTMEFAFMFIPSEAVFYDLLVNKVGAIEARDMVEYAFGKRVIIVSPTSFLAYLQTVLQGLRALEIEETAKGIRKNIEELERHLGSYEVYMRKLGSHLGTAVGTYNTAYKELGKVDKDIRKITEGKRVMEPMTLTAPDLEEVEN